MLNSGPFLTFPSFPYFLKYIISIVKTSNLFSYSTPVTSENRWDSSDGHPPHWSTFGEQVFLIKYHPKGCREHHSSMTTVSKHHQQRARKGKWWWCEGAVRVDHNGLSAPNILSAPHQRFPYQAPWHKSWSLASFWFFSPIPTLTLT